MTETLFYFNGSACPVRSTMPLDNYKSAAEEAILTKLRQGKTLKEIGNEAMETLEIWEKLLCEAMGIKKSYTKKGIKKWINKINNHPSSPITFTEDEITFIWNCGVVTLLKLKRIPNDDNNGTLTISKNFGQLICGKLIYPTSP